MRRFVSRILSGGCLAYIIMLVALVLFRGVPTEAPWWLDLANTFTLYLIILSFPVLLLGLLSFSWPKRLLGVLPVILFVSLYGGMFLPKTSASPESGTTITVMTHNVEAVNSNYERVAKVILEADPDIVALQELTIDIAEGLNPLLSNRYPYQALLPRINYSGVGVYSRFPIEVVETFTAGHMAQHLVLNVYGQKIHLFNYHLLPPRIRFTERLSFLPYPIRDFDTKAQTNEVKAITERVDRAGGPIIVAGDFNMTDQSRQYGQITQNLADTYREIGWGLGHTFPANKRFVPFVLPLIRIDYIFHSQEITGLDIKVGNNSGSDHFPVIARLGLAN